MGKIPRTSQRGKTFIKPSADFPLFIDMPFSDLLCYTEQNRQSRLAGFFSRFNSVASDQSYCKFCKDNLIYTIYKHHFLHQSQKGIKIRYTQFGLTTNSWTLKQVIAIQDENAAYSDILVQLKIIRTLQFRKREKNI